MDIHEVEDKAYIEHCLLNRDIDYAEVASEGSEREFFQYLNERQLLTSLAGSYPLKRVKEEVPRIIKDEGMYDPEGIFIWDAPYIFYAG